MTHTPGPWKAHGSEVWQEGVVVGDRIAMANPWRPEWGDNARLIVAAPDLLAAAESVLTGPSPLPLATIAALRAAVAKARGEEGTNG